MLTAMVCCVMLGMGAALTPRDFYFTIRRSHILGLGLISQYGFMPLIGFAMALVLNLPDPVKVGLLIVSCMPGGVTSNIFTYFARGNLALSVSMTVTSTIFGLVLIPLVLSLYAAALNLEIPRDNIVATLFLLLIPVGLGMALRRFSARAGAVTEALGSALALFFIAFIMLSWIPRNVEFLRDTAPSVYFAAIMLGLFGFAFGYLLTRALRFGPIIARTVALETGIQNAPLAITIIVLNFAPEDRQSILAVVALYALFIVVTSTLLTLVFRRAATGAD